MLGRGLGGRLARGGKQAVRAVAPGVAAALGTLILPGVSQATPAVTNCLPGPNGGEECSGPGGGTAGTAAPLLSGTTEVEIPAFSGDQFYALAVPAADADLGIMVGLSSSDPNLNANLVITAGDELTKRLFVPLVNIGPGSGSATVTQSTGAATIFGVSGGSQTIFSGGNNFPLPTGNILSYTNILVDQAGGNLTVQGGGNSTFMAGTSPVTIGGSGNSTILPAGNNTVFTGNPTVVGVGDTHTIAGGFVFNGDPPGDDLIIGIDLQNPDESLNGGIIVFSSAVDAVASVPEPGTLGLLATALAGLIPWRRRRA